MIFSQEHFDMQTGGARDRTPNISISGRSALLPEPQPYCVCGSFIRRLACNQLYCQDQFLILCHYLNYPQK